MKQVWDRLRAELLLEIIEWTDAVPGAPDPSGDTLAWRFDAGGDPGRSRAIRNGAQLIVREGQWAVFLDEGRIADAFGPGRHTLNTANLPLLTSLLCLPTGFESPFKAEVVFVATRQFSDLKWGTRQPLLLRDPELGPVRLRGFGSYSLRVNDPAWLVRELSGASGRMDLSALQDPLRSLIVSRLGDVLGRSGCPVFDLSSRYEWLARDLRLALLEDTQQFGLEIPSLLIEGLTLPPEVEAALVRRSVRLAEGQASAAAAATPPSTGEGTPAEAAGGGDQPRPRRAPPPPPPPPWMARETPSDSHATDSSAVFQPSVRSTSARPDGAATAPAGTLQVQTLSPKPGLTPAPPAATDASPDAAGPAPAAEAP